MTPVAGFAALQAAIEATCFLTEGIFVLGVCGFAGAGKTTLCRAIVEAFAGRAVHLVCDRFSAASHAQRQARIEAARRSPDPALLEAEENPRHWYAWDAIRDALDGLRNARGFSYERAWNNRTGDLDDTYALALPSSGPVLVLCDGIFLLHPPIRRWLDAALLVDAPPALIAARGRARAPNEARAAVMERLADDYVRPYFTAFAPAADWVYREAVDASRS